MFKVKCFFGPPEAFKEMVDEINKFLVESEAINASVSAFVFIDSNGKTRLHLMLTYREPFEH